MQSSLAHRLEIHDPKHSKTNIAEKKYRQKILIIDFDIFGSIGGGGGRQSTKTLSLIRRTRIFIILSARGQNPRICLAMLQPFHSSYFIVV